MNNKVSFALNSINRDCQQSRRATALLRTPPIVVNPEDVLKMLVHLYPCIVSIRVAGTCQRVSDTPHLVATRRSAAPSIARTRYTK